jgi:hypothetical protein
MPSDKRVYRNWSVSEARRRMKARAVLYKGGKCERCGYDKSLVALDFHHNDPAQKDFQVGQGNYRRWELVQPEIDKCTMLCANCHREEHESLRSVYLTEQRRVARVETPAREYAHKRNCPLCGKEFLVWPSRLAATPDPCCSAYCRGVLNQKVQWPADADLAKQVWVEPATSLARTLGVSSVAVKKRCKRRGIPTPPRGYWAQTSRDGGAE